MNSLVRTYWWRHGQTDWNAQRKWQGHTDIPLNNTGHEQAHALGESLKDLDIQFILTSDLKRAKKTAEIVSSYVETECLALEELREGHYGLAEGLTLPEIRKKLGDKLLEDWKSSDESLLDIRFAGGESKREIVSRVMSCVENQLDSLPFKSVGVSTHGGVLRKVVNIVSPATKLPSPLPNCCCLILDYRKSDGAWELVKFL